MGQDSEISWTDDTNNIAIGCQRVSPACEHCYAETLDARFRFGGQVNWGPGAPRLVRAKKSIAEARASARRAIAEDRPRRVFFSSLCDVYEDRPDIAESRREVWAALDEIQRTLSTPSGSAPLVPLILTKRPEVALRSVGDGEQIPYGSWFGVTVEDQRRANERIPVALAVAEETGCRAFLSVEPLLGAVDLRRIDIGDGWVHPLSGGIAVEGRGHAPYPGVQYVIVGGESGRQARPMHPDWVRSLRDQCAAAGVPFHFKQWGEWLPGMRPHDKALPIGALESGGTWHPGTYRYGPAWDPGCVAWNGNIQDIRTGAIAMVRVGKKSAGRLLDGAIYSEVPGPAVAIRGRSRYQSPEV